MSYLGRFIQDIKRLLFQATSLDYGLSPPLWGEGSQEEATKSRYYSATVSAVALSHIGAYGLSYWAPPWALPPLSRAIHSRQMDTVGRLFGTSRSPTQASTLVPPQAEHAQQDMLPTKSVPPTLAPPMPEATSNDLPITHLIPSTASSTSEASITISATEFHVMVHLF